MASSRVIGDLLHLALLKAGKTRSRARETAGKRPAFPAPKQTKSGEVFAEVMGNVSNVLEKYRRVDACMGRVGVTKEEEGEV
jgi:hypothetical protein